MVNVLYSQLLQEILVLVVKIGGKKKLQIQQVKKQIFSQYQWDMHIMWDIIYGKIDIRKPTARQCVLEGWDHI